VAGCGAIGGRWSAERVEWATKLPMFPLDLSRTDESVFAATYWGVHAFDPSTGEQLWYTELDDPDDTVETSGVVDADDEGVYTATSSATIALDRTDGTRRWTDSHANGQAELRTSEDSVVVCGTGVTVYDATEGDVRWRTDETSGDYTRPAVADGTVFVGNDRDLAAFDLEDGTGRWTWEFGIGATVTAPTVAEGTVYAGVSGPSGDTLVAVDAADGTVEWRRPTVSKPGSPTYAGAGVFAGSYRSAGGQLVAHDAGDGTRRWSYERSTATRIGQPAVVDDTVVASGGETILAVDAGTGSVDWQFDVGGGAEPKPVVFDGTLYVSGASHLVALRTDTHD
jgi:outer membrane protein assembly factor BamB